MLLAKVYGAAQAKADVVISLCRMGRNQLYCASQAAIWLLDSDDPDANPNLDFILRDLATSMVRWRRQGKTVLVHCVEAESRTPAVAAAYLAERFGLSGEEALTRVRGQLPRTRAIKAFAEAVRRRWRGW